MAKPTPEASRLGVETRRIKTLTKAQTLAPRIMAMQARGMSLTAIAESLTRDGVRGLAGGRWRPDSVRRVLDIASGTTAHTATPEPWRPEPAPEPEPWRCRVRII